MIKQVAIKTDKNKWTITTSDWVEHYKGEMDGVLDILREQMIKVDQESQKDIERRIWGKGFKGIQSIVKLNRSY